MVHRFRRTTIKLRKDFLTIQPLKITIDDIDELIVLLNGFHLQKNVSKNNLTQL